MPGPCLSGYSGRLTKTCKEGASIILTTRDDSFYAIMCSTPTMQYLSLFAYTIGTCSTVMVFKSLRDGSQSLSFRVPWTKTTRKEGASIIVTAREDPLCPCTAMRNHLNTNCLVPTSWLRVPLRLHLFAYTTGTSGQWEHMMKHRFLEFCVEVWTSAALAQAPCPWPQLSYWRSC